MGFTQETKFTYWESLTPEPHHLHLGLTGRNFSAEQRQP